MERVTGSDNDDENPSFTLKDYDEEQHEEEYESNDDYENMFEEEDDDLYKDVNSYEQVIKDTHVTLNSSQKTESSKQSSSVSFDFASKFLILENVPPAIDEVASMMNVKIRQDESSTLAPSLFTVPVTSTIMESLENFVLAKSSSQPQSTYEAAASLIEFELKKILLDKLEKSKLYRAADDHRNLYDALVKSYQVDKELFDSYGKAYSLKRSREDKDEDPPAGPDQGLKKKKTSKDADPSRGSKSKVSKSCSFKGTKSLSKSSGKSA
ncbi:hypothetical protein Tco_0080382 [Tanacetum coccineum]